jgi:hypothetical protein
LCSGEDMIIIREEKEEDREAIRAVNEKAFGQPDEADIVDRLRKSWPNRLSLVALAGDEVVGHILFSPAKIEGDMISAGNPVMDLFDSRLSIINFNSLGRTPEATSFCYCFRRL